MSFEKKDKSFIPLEPPMKSQNFADAKAPEQ